MFTNLTQLLFNNLVAPLPFLKIHGNAPTDAESYSESDEAVEQQALLANEEELEETATLPADLGQSGFDVLPKRS